MSEAEAAVASASSAPSPAQRAAIAVDGLSGAGKSTVSRRVAGRLGWAYLDTGATYRAITVAALRAGRVAPGATVADEPLGDLALQALAGLDLSTDPAVTRVRLAGEDVTGEIRSAATTATVSAVAADPAVRAAAVRWQREQVASADGCVVEGRDIGTVVLPDAALKIWLTASPDRRSARRAAEGATNGPAGGATTTSDRDADDTGPRVRASDGGGHTAATSAVAVREAIERRDRLDSGRVADPARPADDAVVVDTDELDVDAVVARVLALAADRGLAGAR